MELRDITYTINDHVAQVSLIRPAALNAIRQRTIEELEFVVEQLGEHNAQGMVITGTGLVFCSGLEPAMAFSPKARTSFQHLIRVLLRQPRICICAVNGAAIGAGVDLALASDLCIAGDRSTFSFSGSIGANGSSNGFGLNHSRRQSGDPAERRMVTGEIFTARQALASKLVDYVVKPEHVLNFALAEAKTMIRYSPQSIRMANAANGTSPAAKPRSRFLSISNPGC
jgi:enoyl-CoA hydratase/carnithine racemase